MLLVRPQVAPDPLVGGPLVERFEEPEPSPNTTNRSIKVVQSRPSHGMLSELR